MLDADVAIANAAAAVDVLLLFRIESILSSAKNRSQTENTDKFELLKPLLLLFTEYFLCMSVGCLFLKYRIVLLPFIRVKKNITSYEYVLREAIDLYDCVVAAIDCIVVRKLAMKKKFSTVANS